MDMAKITLTMRSSITVPLEAEVITPDGLAGKSEEEIKSLTVYHGNREMKLGDFFDVSVEGSGDPASTEIIMKGDLTRVKRIGEGMTAGSIVIEGSCDMHCGALMRGGKITVKGDADAWAGREMRGGELVIEGNAGNYLGAGYRGEMTGMRGGKITVEGDAGDYIGEHMAGGEILVKGNVGILPGLSMTGGRIIIEGSATMPGGEMTKGEIIVKGEVYDMLPGFRFEGEEEIEGKRFRKYTGDLAVRGVGKGVLLLG